MQSILLLVHLEETFRVRFHNRLVGSLVKSLRNQEYDEVIHFTSYCNDECPIHEITPYIDRDIEWGWGHEPEMFSESEREFVIPSNGHEWTWISPDIRRLEQRLRENTVILGGGCDGECLANMETILDHLDIPYRRKMDFIYC